ncbi:MAG: CBS domain-containing protein [bacterium]|nr:CBS domain-containing protein [bacterium]
MKTGIHVADAMSVNPVTISITKTILECARIMVKKRVGSLLIIKEENLEGIITEKDLVHFLAKGLDPKATKVREIMTNKILTISPEEDLYNAIIRMKREKIRRLPVVNKKKLVGMLTINDVLKLQPALFDLMVEKGNIRLDKKKEKYVEGTCEVCENFERLYEIDDQYICAECRDEHTAKSAGE